MDRRTLKRTIRKLEEHIECCELEYRDLIERARDTEELGELQKAIKELDDNNTDCEEKDSLLKSVEEILKRTGAKTVDDFVPHDISEQDMEEHGRYVAAMERRLEDLRDRLSETD